MRIAIFTNNYLPNPYGVSGSIESFRKEFERNGHNVYIFAPKWKGHNDENPNVFRYPAISTNIKFQFPLAIPYSWKMDKIIEGLDLDIIHAQHPNLLGFAGLKWARKKKIPLVFTWHTLYDQYTHFVPFVPGRWAANWIIKKAVSYANKADQVIVPTESIKDIIRKWGVKNKKIEAVMTGIEENEFDGADREKIREKYGIEKDETLLLTISRLTAEKNIEFLFQQVLKIVGKNPKIKYLVVGEGYLREKLEAEVEKKSLSERIIFVGEIKREQVKDYYAAGDIFIYASKSETQGMIFSEAMYMGLPVVTLRATGAQDLITDGENGLLSDEDNFQDNVLKLVNNATLRMSFAENAKNTAKKNYTSGKNAERMLKIYEDLINKQEA